MKNPMKISLIKEIIDRNWNFFKFVQLTILKQKTLQQRAITTEQFIKMGEHFTRRNNYQRVTNLIDEHPKTSTIIDIT